MFCLMFFHCSLFSTANMILFFFLLYYFSFLAHNALSEMMPQAVTNDT
jgi:hypothetical protein